MPSGIGLRSRVDRVLQKLNATAFPVTLRQTVTTGGNALLGVGGTVSVLDTVMVPPPSVRLLSADEVVTSGGFFQAGDYRIVCSGSIPRATLRNSLLLYGEQILQITRVDESVIDGTVLAWTITARSIHSGE